jgi:hypothetical protein
MMIRFGLALASFPDHALKWSGKGKWSGKTRTGGGTSIIIKSVLRKVNLAKLAFSIFQAIAGSLPSCHWQFASTIAPRQGERRSIFQSFTIGFCRRSISSGFILGISFPEKRHFQVVDCFSGEFSQWYFQILSLSVFDTSVFLPCRGFHMKELGLFFELGIKAYLRNKSHLSQFIYHKHARRN